MKPAMNLQLAQFKQPVLIFNGISLIMGFWFTYKHYFDNAGKGIDDAFYALSLLSLQSFFGLMALAKTNHLRSCKKWLLIGILYLIVTAVFMEIELALFKGVWLIAIIPLVFYLIPLFLNKQIQLFNYLQGVFIFSYLTSGFTVYAFVMLIITILGHLVLLI